MFKNVTTIAMVSMGNLGGEWVGQTPQLSTEAPLGIVGRVGGFGMSTGPPG